MSPPKLLLADDSLPSLLATQAMLEKLGYNVTITESGENAHVMAREQRFDVILLDEHLPGMRGSEVAALLRGNSNPNNRTPIYSLTGEVDTTARQRILAAGVNAIIDKPVNRDRLQEVLGGQTQSLDPQTLATLYEDLGDATAQRLLGLFAKELGELSGRLVAVTPENGVSEISAISHILKNSAALYGAMELAALARSLNESTELTAENAMAYAQQLKQKCDLALAQVVAVLEPGVSTHV